MISRQLTEQDADVLALICDAPYVVEVQEIARICEMTFDDALDSLVRLALRQPDPEA